MTIPEPWEAVLLALAAYRLWRLLALDEILRPVRERAIHRAEKPGEIYVGKGSYREELDIFVHCPWCLGFWIALGFTGAWWAWPDATLTVAVPLAASAAVGLLGKTDA